MGFPKQETDGIKQMVLLILQYSTEMQLSPRSGG